MPTIKEPIVCCPNDPDAAKFLTEVSGTHIDEAFSGSCMTHIGHFRAAAKPTQTESSQSTQSASPKRPAHDLWAVLMACIYEVFPTLCPLCGGQMRIIAFITHSADIGHILEHIGAQTKPPRITPAHDLWAVLMRRWAMVSTLRQIGMKRPKRRRTLRSVSASVAKLSWSGKATAGLPTLRGRVLPGTAQSESWRQISKNLGQLARCNHPSRPQWGGF